MQVDDPRELGLCTELRYHDQKAPSASEGRDDTHNLAYTHLYSYPFILMVDDQASDEIAAALR